MTVEDGEGSDLALDEEETDEYGEGTSELELNDADEFADMAVGKPIYCTILELLGFGVCAKDKTQGSRKSLRL